MGKNKRLLVLFYLVLRASEALSSESLGICHGKTGHSITPLTTTDILHHLFVNFNRTDVKEKMLKFRAESIDLKDGTIIFSNPRLNERTISYYRNDCLEKKKNFLGLEICQKIGQTSVAKKLCEQLGLIPHESIEGELEVVRSSKEPFSFQYNEGEWHSMRLYSALAPPIRYPRLKTLTCKYL